jgi:hypothetical protein
MIELTSTPCRQSWVNSLRNLTGFGLAWTLCMSTGAARIIFVVLDFRYSLCA